MVKNKLLLLIMLTTTTLRSQNDEQQFQKCIAEGIALHDKGKYQDAVKKFQYVLKENPEHPSANYELANTYVAMRCYKDAMRHADKAIEQVEADFPDAYVLKGNVQDMMGQITDAIHTYEMGIAQYPNHYLLHFNLAVALWGNKQYEKAEYALIKSISLRPNHAGSHLVLGLLNRDRGCRIKGILALYNFLLLEPEGQRAENAFKSLQNLTKEVIQRVKYSENDKITLTTTGLSDETDEFKSIELAWAVAQLLEKNNIITEHIQSDTISELTRFAIENEKLFQLLSDLKEGKKGFYWEFYVDFFDDMHQKNHTETMSYFVSLARKEHQVMQWFQSHPQKLEALSNWYAGFEWKYQSY